MHSTNDMTVGSPLRAIIKFAIPLILGYILQQMYLIIDENNRIVGEGLRGKEIEEAVAKLLGPAQ